ncbi:ferredoxin [Streptomyces hyderabadensis]|uniref:Ferredoxin n=1 Tax=Streptomyces hyderabadensis TaxID=598549 RepID=A0ABP9HHJ2_9ACTN|nr:ferredoxin [Streptomyces hyderabadensis]
MKAAVDATKCNAYGTCADHCPSVFQLDEWGYGSVVGDGTVAEAEIGAAKVAAADCPEKAITLIDA